MNSDYSFNAAFRLALFIFKVLFCLAFLLSIVAGLVFAVAWTINDTRQHRHAQAEARAATLRKYLQSSNDTAEWDAIHAKMLHQQRELEQQAVQRDQ